MKKLILFITVAFFATIGHAQTYNWNTSAINLIETEHTVDLDCDFSFINKNKETALTEIDKYKDHCKENKIQVGYIVYHIKTNKDYTKEIIADTLIQSHDKIPEWMVKKVDLWEIKNYYEYEQPTLKGFETWLKKAIK